MPLRSKSKAKDAAGVREKAETSASGQAVNAVLAGIILRGLGDVVLDKLEQRLVIARYDPARARDLIDGRTVFTSLALYGASKLATRSVPGLAVVAGGLFAKSLYDRGKRLQRSRARTGNARTGE
ncbi:MAG: hypothetical protein AAF494_02040 [Pseudomonadota bacterium]